MKILKLLSRYFTIFLIIFCTMAVALSEEKPVDIWNIDEKKTNDTSLSSNQNEITSSDEVIYETKSISGIEEVKLDKKILTKDIKIVGLYDPAENGLSINMWRNTDGDQLKNIFKNLNKMQLSKDAKEILNISLLTNAYYPSKNISLNEFLEIKSNWLIKNSDLELLENYVVSNQLVNENPELIKFLVDEYLSQSNLDKSCEIFNQISDQINDNYLSKFNIYCLINNDKIDEAQLIFDLKKELGFKDEY